MSLGRGWSLLELRQIVWHRIVALFFSIEGEGKTARTCGKAYDWAELGGKQVRAVKASFDVAMPLLYRLRLPTFRSSASIRDSKSFSVFNP